MSTPVRVTRRQFLHSAAAAGVSGPLILTSTSSLRAAPSDRINLGFIGVGTQGGGHVGGFLGRGDVQIVAICDVVAERREHSVKTVEEYYAKYKTKGTPPPCKAYADFRQLLDRRDIDAGIDDRRG